VCVTIAVIISIYQPRAFLGGKNERSWSSIRNQACFLCDVVIIY